MKRWAEFLPQCQRLMGLGLLSEASEVVAMLYLNDSRDFDHIDWHWSISDRQLVCRPMMATYVRHSLALMILGLTGSMIVYAWGPPWPLGPVMGAPRVAEPPPVEFTDEELEKHRARLTEMRENLRGMLTPEQWEDFERREVQQRQAAELRRDLQSQRRWRVGLALTGLYWLLLAPGLFWMALIGVRLIRLPAMSTQLTRSPDGSISIEFSSPARVVWQSPPAAGLVIFHGWVVRRFGRYQTKYTLWFVQIGRVDGAPYPLLSPRLFVEEEAGHTNGAVVPARVVDFQQALAKALKLPIVAR